MYGISVYLDKLKSKFYRKYPLSVLKIVGINPDNSYILVKDEWGICSIRQGHLINGVIPTITSAIDKNQYFINKAKSYHKDRYDYSLVKYKTAHIHIKIICKKHGEFLQSANIHVRGKGCPKCGDESCSKHHSDNPTGWTKSNWFEASKKSNQFDSFKVYIIRCWNNEEDFIKIGRTFLPIKRRFCSKRTMPYNYEIIKVYEDDCEKIYNLEGELKRLNKSYRYAPNIKFKGDKECYTNMIKYE